jgi:hypothetical protein
MIVRLTLKAQSFTVVPLVMTFPHSRYARLRRLRYPIPCARPGNAPLPSATMQPIRMDLHHPFHYTLPSKINFIVMRADAHGK